MRVDDASALITPLLPLHKAADAMEADWMRAFALARLCTLAVAFMALPLALALDPLAIAGNLSIYLAAVLSAVLGLSGLIYISPVAALAASALGLGVLVVGPTIGDSNLTTGIVGLAVLGCDAFSAPASARSKRWLLALMASVGVVILLVSFAEVSERANQTPVALVLLLLAPLVTLAISLSSLRERSAQLQAVGADELRRSEAFLREAGVAIFLADRAGQVADANASAGALLSAQPDNLVGRGLFDRVLIVDRPAYLKATSDAAMLGKYSELSLHLAVGDSESGRPRNGQPGPPLFELFDLSVRPVPGRAETIVIRLSAAVASMQPPQRDRSEFLQTLSHEIRTPMNAILGFSEILANPKIMPERSEQIADYARIIHRSAREAFAVTRALSDLMRIEDKSFEPVPETISLRETVTAVASSMSEHSLAGQGSGYGRVHVQDGPDDTDIIGDPRLCRMMLTAVFEGLAIHAGPEAPISCSIRRNGPIALVEIMAQVAQSPSPGSGYFGVIEALCREAGAHCGAKTSLTFTDTATTAILEFAAASTVVVLHPGAPTAPVPHPFLSENILQLRKSA